MKDFEQKIIHINGLAKTALSEVARSTLGARVPHDILESISKLLRKRRPIYVEEHSDKVGSLLASTGLGPVLVIRFEDKGVTTSFEHISSADLTHNKEGRSGLLTNSLNVPLEELY